MVHRLGHRYVAGRLQPWIEEQATAAAEVTGRRMLGEALVPIEDTLDAALDAAVEALRFLSARVEALEGAADLRREPVDGLAWLLAPPSLEQWARPVAEWLGRLAAGEVLHAECGEGTLAAALAAAGLRVRGVEPRGSFAWQAAEGGLDVHVGSVQELLAAPGTPLGGLVLSGVVDRVALDEQLQLLAMATDRLARGAPIVIIGTVPGAVGAGWDVVARDLLPGRPLHPETWEMLLVRAGYDEVGRLEPIPTSPSSGLGERGAPAPATYAVKGRRPL